MASRQDNVDGEQDRVDRERMDETIKRVKRYWYDDGVTEFGAGVIFLAIGLLFAFEARQPEGTALAAVSAFGLPILVIGGGLLVGRGVKAVKERLTYPRTGYVAYRKQGARRRGLAMGLAVGIAVGVVVGLAYAHDSLGGSSYRWIPVFDGIVIGAFLLYMAHSFEISRFYVLTALSFAVGGWAGWYSADETVGSSLYFGLMGVALVLSGAWALRRYLVHTEPGRPRENSTPTAEVSS